MPSSPAASYAVAQRTDKCHCPRAPAPCACVMAAAVPLPPTAWHVAGGVLRQFPQFAGSAALLPLPEHRHSMVALCSGMLGAAVAEAAQDVSAELQRGLSLADAAAACSIACSIACLMVGSARAPKDPPPRSVRDHSATTRQLLGNGRPLRPHRLLRAGRRRGAATAGPHPGFPSGPCGPFERPCGRILRDS